MKQAIVRSEYLLQQLQARLKREGAQQVRVIVWDSCYIEVRWRALP